MSGAPALLVGIDTEGDNQWDVRARRHQTFENIYALERLHDVFAEHGVRPTYLVTYPVATDPRGLIQWIAVDKLLPETVREALFQQVTEATA